MARTALLIKPSLDEVQLLAAKIGLPPLQADAFYWHYNSIGWKVGKNPMKCWKSALQGWRARWQDRYQHERERPAPPYVLQKELERILARLREIEGEYSEHQDMSKKHVEEKKRLKERKMVLWRELGVII